MLVLTRRVNESIIVGNADITITILAAHGGNVRVGIEAAPEVAVHRKEVFDAIARGERPRVGRGHGRRAMGGGVEGERAGG